ncbi:hypothetical protein N0X72_25415 [Streptomyces carpaticus]|uniref:hypothetical protein n=1 Tax=Streptomyces carpaticus TaxID=285558 RepID=UPI00220FB284|nr:hypothetical protein N0X72_25415 [Streptomyces carpaticus]
MNPRTAEAAREQAVADLRTVREHWGDLLAAIETPPADTWPPRQLAHLMRPTNDGPELVADRAPLVLRDYPAPLNLDALDAGTAVERQVFDLCDTLAAAVQLPAAAGDPRAWVLPTHSASVTHRAASPGSRIHGLHWACVWVEGRLLDDDTTGPDALFNRLPGYLLDEAAGVAARAAGRVLGALGLDRRHTPISRPCPACGGPLTLHTDPDGPPTVTCAQGADCPAAVPLDRSGRRVWEWPAVLDLGPELTAAA